MWRLLVLLTVIIVISTNQHANAEGMIEVFQWKQVDYYNRGDGTNRPVSGNVGNRNSGTIIFPDRMPYGHKHKKRATTKVTSRDDPINVDMRWGGHHTDATATNTSSYIAYNNVPMGVSHYKGRLFVTMPRRHIGIPSTLNYIDLRKDGDKPSPKLRAYPDFETNSLNANFEPNPNRLISVYRTTIDDCKRLWFIDTGMLEYPGNRIQVQRPSIWVIDLKTDRVLQRFEIPETTVDTGRGLASIAVDVHPNNCENAYAYIPDLVNSQLFVYHLESNRIWAFSHNYFNFDPLGGDLSIGGQNFRWDDGIFSVTLGPYDNHHNERTVYFHAMASTNEFMVSNKVLQNESNAARSEHGNDFKLLGSRGAMRQSTMHEYDSNTHTIFYDEIQLNGIGCWNVNKKFSRKNHGTVAQDAERMIYPSDLTIDEDGTMWVMTNSMPIFIYSNLDPNQVNFRIWKQNVHEAVKNTVCDA